jgi:hypothetical protein
VLTRHLLLITCACCWFSPAGPSAATSWQPDVHRAIAYAHTRAGDVSFAVRTEHRVWGFRVTRLV